MDAKLIEYLDRQRFRSMLWTTIGYALFFGSGIVGELTYRMTVVTPILILLALVGFAVLIGGAIAYYSNQRVIRKSPELKKALKNELIKHYEYKAFKWGFVGAYFAVAVLYILSPRWENLTVKISCLILMYIPVMIYSLTYLIYLRR